MNNYGSLRDALNDLKERGYDRYFDMKYSSIYCGLLDLQLTPEEFIVEEVHRFQDDSNPDDESVLYVIASKDGAVKGVLVDAYGVYAESMSFDMAAKLQIQNKL